MEERPIVKCVYLLMNTSDHLMLATAIAIDNTRYVLDTHHVEARVYYCRSTQDSLLWVAIAIDKHY